MLKKNDIDQNIEVIESFKEYHNLKTNTGRRTTFNANIKYIKDGQNLDINSDINIDDNFKFNQYEVTICKLCGENGEFHSSFNTNFQIFTFEEGCLNIENKQERYKVTIELKIH